MTVHVMVDLETLSTRPNAAIASIGAVSFDPYGNGLPPLAELPESTGKFYVRVNLESCINAGLHIQASTVAWWFQQDDESRKEMGSAMVSGVYLKEALWVFRKWIQEVKPGKLWSHGATFDLPILSLAFSQCNLQEPWDYKNLRDTRTHFENAGYVYKYTGPGKHNALVDAYYQALAVQTAYKLLRKDAA